MPLTVDPSPNPYCTPAQFLNEYDARIVGDLVRDDGYPAGGSAAQTLPAIVAALPTDPNLLAALQAASGEVDTEAAIGGRYAPSDLANLAAAGGNGAAFLARIVAILAWGILSARRGRNVAEDARVLWARSKLDRLSDGESIFPFVEVEAAGLPAERTRTWAEIDSQHLLTSDIALRRYMGCAAGRSSSRYGSDWSGDGYFGR